MAGFLLAAMAAAAMAQADPAPAASPAAAADAAPTQAAAAAKPATAKSDKVCVEEPQMGSHFRRKVCATREEWARRQRHDQEVMSDDAPRSSK